MTLATRTRRLNKLLKDDPNKFNGWTFREETPDGTAWIHIIEEEPGVIFKIIMQIGKAGSSLNSYCSALSELATLYVRESGTITDLIDVLFGIISSSAGRMRTGPDDPVNRSGAEALASALRKYLQSLPQSVLIEQGERKGGFTKLSA